MRYIVLAVFFIQTITTVQAESLDKISQFAKEICDEIKQEGKTKISKKDIEGKLINKDQQVANMIGAKITGGKITYGEANEEYEGLPLTALPEQMSDSRDCKKEMAKMLLKERKKVKKKLSQAQLGTREDEIKDLSKEYANLREDFNVFADTNKIDRIDQKIPHGQFNTQGYDDHIKSKLGAMSGKYQGMLLMITLMPTIQEVSKGAKTIKNALDNVDVKKYTGNKTKETQYISMQQRAQILEQRSTAMLLEMSDLVQNMR